MWRAYADMVRFLTGTDSRTYDDAGPRRGPRGEWIQRCNEGCQGRACGACDHEDLRIRASTDRAGKDERELDGRAGAAGRPHRGGPPLRLQGAPPGGVPVRLRRVPALPDPAGRATGPARPPGSPRSPSGPSGAGLRCGGLPGPGHRGGVRGVRAHPARADFCQAGEFMIKLCGPAGTPGWSGRPRSSCCRPRREDAVRPVGYWELELGLPEAQLTAALRRWGGAGDRACPAEVRQLLRRGAVEADRRQGARGRFVGRAGRPPDRAADAAAGPSRALPGGSGAARQAQLAAAGRCTRPAGWGSSGPARWPG